MLIDSIIYNGEAEMLEFRLHMLWDKVDRFVIVQANHTFSGIPKSFDSMDRFSWANNKILLSSLYMQPNIDPWINETNQRNAIIDSCDNFSNEDILMLSDVDEIPSYSAIDFRKSHILMYPMACDQVIIPYNLNYAREDNGWRGTVMCDLGYARDQTAQGIRNMRQQYSPFPSGGWHLTFFGGAENIKKKIESYSHQEHNIPEITNILHIENCIKNRGQLFPEEVKSQIKIVDKLFYPEYFVKLVPNQWWS